MRKVVSNRGEFKEIMILPESQVQEILSNLKKIRSAKNLTQSDVAKRLDISSVQYGNIEGGKSKISLIQLLQVIDIIDCPLNEVFNFGEEISDSVKSEINALKSEIERLKDHNDLLRKAVKNA